MSKQVGEMCHKYVSWILLKLFTINVKLCQSMNKARLSKIKWSPAWRRIQKLSWAHPTLHIDNYCRIAAIIQSDCDKFLCWMPSYLIGNTFFFTKSFKFKSPGSEFFSWNVKFSRKSLLSAGPGSMVGILTL